MQANDKQSYQAPEVRTFGSIQDLTGQTGLTKMKPGGGRGGGSGGGSGGGGGPSGPFGS